MKGGVNLPKISKAKRIDNEFTKLKKLYSEIPQNKFDLLLPLIQNAAFMKVTLEELQETINQEGATDEYCNGANQFGRKQSANIQAYNSLVKNYNNVIDKLEKLLPAEAKRSRLTDFIE